MNQDKIEKIKLAHENLTKLRYELINNMNEGEDIFSSDKRAEYKDIISYKNCVVISLSILIEFLYNEYFQNIFGGKYPPINILEEKDIEKLIKLNEDDYSILVEYYDFVHCGAYAELGETLGFKVNEDLI